MTDTSTFIRALWRLLGLGELKRNHWGPGSDGDCVCLQLGKMIHACIVCGQQIHVYMACTPKGGTTAWYSNIWFKANTFYLIHGDCLEPE